MGLEHTMDFVFVGGRKGGFLIFINKFVTSDTVMGSQVCEWYVSEQETIFSQFIVLRAWNGLNVCVKKRVGWGNCNE